MPNRRPTRRRPVPQPAQPPEPGYVFTRRSLESVSVFRPSVAWAEEVLRDYGLDDWDWLVHDLAETMDEAALSAAEQWERDYREQLAGACQYPRWCPCGRWPDFGTGCPYHGPCACIGEYDDYPNRGEPRLKVVRWNRDEMCLGPGCPVHPEGWIPPDALAANRAALRSRGMAFTATLLGPRGRTT